MLLEIKKKTSPQLSTGSMQANKTTHLVPIKAYSLMPSLEEARKANGKGMIYQSLEARAKENS